MLEKYIFQCPHTFATRIKPHRIAPNQAKPVPISFMHKKKNNKKT